MVDTFAAAHPHAAGRFTCWVQYQNKRFDNEGTRIDYIAVDAGLHRPPLEHPTLYGGCAEHAPDTPEAAHLACTAHGRWKPAPFDGTGIAAGTAQDYDAQFYVPHTGFIYTPVGWCFCVTRMVFY
jgi:hypothetical protein